MKQKEMIDHLIYWYQKNKRDLPWRKTKNAYFIWISEVMLQQTRVETVIPYFEKFINRLPTIQSLARIDEDELMKLWEGLGYYNRVRNMKKSAEELVKQGKKELPNTYDELIKLKGIGPYTAGAISSIAFNEKKAAVDGNVLRVFSRIQNSKENINDLRVKKHIEEYLTSIIPDDASTFNQSLMELGATICIPKAPRCNICPIQNYCKAYQKGTMYMLPIKTKNKIKKEEEVKVLLYIYENKVAIIKRESKGLLASLFAFPIASYNDEIPNDAIIIGPYTHIFTHKIWKMTGYIINVKKKSSDYLFVSPETIKKKYAIATAFSYFLKDISLYLSNKKSNHT